MLSEITPVILTYNEAANLERTLSHLAWARDIVILDSGSSDGTAEVAGRFAQVRWFERPFDTHAEQWRHAISETGIETPWVLRLDADYVLPKVLVDEVSRLRPPDDVNAYRIAFDYAVQGRRLRASLYPPNTVLFRGARARVYDRGHTEAWEVPGRIEALRGRILHDDRKPLGQWLAAQGRYMALERDRLRGAGGRDLRLSDRLRRVPLVMPILSFLYCLIGKALILDGRAGLHYATQRLVAEAILSLMLLEAGIRREAAEQRPE